MKYTFGKYRVDGESVHRVTEESNDKGYAIWRVFHENGSFMCGFYGPASFGAACTYAKELSSQPEYPPQG